MCVAMCICVPQELAVPPLPLRITVGGQPKLPRLNDPLLNAAASSAAAIATTATAAAWMVATTTTRAAAPYRCHQATIQRVGTQACIALADEGFVVMLPRTSNLLTTSPNTLLLLLLHQHFVQRPPV